MTEQNKSQEPLSLQPTVEFGWIDTAASLLDNKFKIPFTQVRFGVDSLIGLIPGVGDWLGLGISSILVIAIMRRGVGIGMLLKMMGNILLDGTIGSIPIIGDIFDFRHKANRRNVEMLRQYYIENPNPPSAKRGFFWVALMVLCIIIVAFYACLKMMQYLWIALT
jgi:hypothetical protein